MVTFRQGDGGSLNLLKTGPFGNGSAIQVMTALLLWRAPRWLRFEQFLHIRVGSCWHHAHPCRI